MRARTRGLRLNFRPYTFPDTSAFRGGNASSGVAGPTPAGLAAP